MTIERVLEVEKVYEKNYRVLKPRGVFWYIGPNATCLKQGEILGFPLSGWYPDSLKRKIMNWVKAAKPHSINYARTPAVNLDTLSEARILLLRQEFRQI